MKRFATLALVLCAVAACGPQDTVDPTFCAVPIDDSPRRGPTDATVTVVEFADFECPYCRSAEPTIVAVLEERAEEVALVFKHTPSSYHTHGLSAALAAVCAGEQGVFWEMHDELIAPEAALDDAALADYAGAIGLDVATWQDCLDSDAAYLAVEEDLELAVDSGVTGTPTFFINGRALVGAPSLEAFLDVVDEAAEAAAKSGLTPAEHYAELQRRPCR